jgi:hypothetical protein
MQTGVAVTVGSTPFSSGLVFVDGTAIATPTIFYWQVGSSHSFFIAGGVNRYQFQYWQLDGAIYTYSPNFNYVVDAAHTFNAFFGGQAGQGGVPVAINSVPFTGFDLIQVDGNPINTPYIFYWALGSTHTIVAAPGGANGVPFQYWSIDGNEYTSASGFTYQVDGPHTLTAVFSPLEVPEFSGGETGIMALAMMAAIIAMRRRKEF